MKIGTPKTLSVHGKSIEVTFLGRGQFCSAYKSGEKVYQLCPKGDEAKQIYSDSENVHIPETENWGYQYPETEHPDETQVFVMKFYNKLTSKNKIAWAQAKKLRELLIEAQSEVNSEYRGKIRHYYLIGNIYNDRLLSLIENSDLPESIYQAIEQLNSNASNYGEFMTYEFPNRNLAVDDNGNLILLDVMFNSKTVWQFWNDKAKNRY